MNTATEHPLLSMLDIEEPLRAIEGAKDALFYFAVSDVFGSDERAAILCIHEALEVPLAKLREMFDPAPSSRAGEDSRIAELCEVAKRAYAAYCAAPDTNTDEENEILIVPADKAENELMQIPATTCAGAVQKLLASARESADGTLEVRVDGLFQSAVADLRRLEKMA